MKDKKNRQKGIEAAKAALQKRFKEPVITEMSKSNQNIKTFSSGRADLDEKLGGGYPVGKIIEIFAPEATGKTGLALEAVAQTQKLGGIAAIIDAEHALNTEYCEQIGVNVEDLLIVQPSYGEQGFEAMKTLISTANVDLIVVDSVSEMTPLAILEGEVGEAKMGALARLMSKGLASIKGIASERECTIIFLNQLREKITMYGNPETTTGGNSLKFYASLRIDVRNKGAIKDGEEVIGFKQQIKIVKNKIAPPFKILMNDIIYGKGVDTIAGLIEACVEKEIIKKSGSWYSFQETRLGQGFKSVHTLLEDNVELVEELEDLLKSVK